MDSKNNYNGDDMPEELKQQIQWIAKRLGYDHFLFAGYKAEEFEKHILSQGLYENGTPAIALEGSIAGAAYIIARLLCDFSFSYELRRAVHSIINSVETGREIKKNVAKNTE